MRYPFLFSILFIVILTGCGKDKFKTTPSLKFKDVNTKELHSGQVIRFTLTFTDAQGDISDSLYVEKSVPYCANSTFSAWYPVPSFPVSKDLKGDITVNFEYNAGLGYQNIAPQCQMNDTAVFRFALKDKDHHVSDTISSPPIIIYYQ